MDPTDLGGIGVPQSSSKVIAQLECTVARLQDKLAGMEKERKDYESARAKEGEEKAKHPNEQEFEKEIFSLKAQIAKMEVERDASDIHGNRIVRSAGASPVTILPGRGGSSTEDNGGSERVGDLVNKILSQKVKDLERELESVREKSKKNCKNNEGSDKEEIEDEEAVSKKAHEKLASEMQEAESRHLSELREAENKNRDEILSRERAQALAVERMQMKMKAELEALDSKFRAEQDANRVTHDAELRSLEEKHRAELGEKQQQIEAQDARRDGEIRKLELQTKSRSEEMQREHAVLEKKHNDEIQRLKEQRLAQSAAYEKQQEKLMSLSVELGEARGTLEAIKSDRESLRKELEVVKVEYEGRIGRYIGKLDVTERRVEEARGSKSELQNSSALQAKIEALRDQRELSDKRLKSLERKNEKLSKELQGVKDEAERRIRKAAESVKDARQAADSAIKIADEKASSFEAASGKLQALQRELQEEKERSQKLAISTKNEKLAQDSSADAVEMKSVGVGTVASQSDGSGSAVVQRDADIDTNSLSELMESIGTLRRQLATAEAGKASSERALIQCQTRLQASLMVNELHGNGGKSRGKGIDESGDLSGSPNLRNVEVKHAKVVADLEAKLTEAEAAAASAREGWQCCKCEFNFLWMSGKAMLANIIFTLGIFISFRNLLPASHLHGDLKPNNQKQKQ